MAQSGTECEQWEQVGPSGRPYATFREFLPGPAEDGWIFARQPMSESAELLEAEIASFVDFV